MADGFSVVRRARKPYRCDTQTHVCVGMIQPGERYAYSKLPPGGELGYETWQSDRCCAPCAMLYDRPCADELRSTAGPIEVDPGWDDGPEHAPARPVETVHTFAERGLL